MLSLFGLERFDQATPEPEDRIVRARYKLSSLTPPRTVRCRYTRIALRRLTTGDLTHDLISSLEISETYRHANLWHVAC